MGHEVGPEGQVVIDRHIRDQLGVGPGWQTVQILVDDHVEIYFVPPEHNRSLGGTLRPDVRRTFPTTEELRRAREESWTVEDEDDIPNAAVADVRSDPLSETPTSCFAP